MGRRTVYLIPPLLKQTAVCTGSIYSSQYIQQGKNTKIKGKGYISEH